MKVFFGVVLILAGPCAACLVGMRDDMLLMHNWDNNYLFCSLTSLLIALAFRCLGKAKIESMEEYSETKT